VIIWEMARRYSGEAESSSCSCAASTAEKSE